MIKYINYIVIYGYGQRKHFYFLKIIVLQSILKFKPQEIVSKALNEDRWDLRWSPGLSLTLPHRKLYYDITYVRRAQQKASSQFAIVTAYEKGV